MNAQTATIIAPANASATPNYKRRARLAEWFKNGILIFICVALLFPLGLMLVMSVKDKEQIVYQFFTIQPPFHFENI